MHDFSDSKRIVIIGATGSGKTTLARQLAQTYGLPYTDLDDLYWNPGWVASEKTEFRNRVLPVTDHDKWIVTGNYRSVRDIVWKKADTILWLDYSFFRCLRQLVLRTFKRVIDKQSVCNGNTETMAMTLSKNSIVLWLFKSYRQHKKDYENLFSNPEIYPNIACFIRFKR